MPPAGATPASGNFVYLESEVGDLIGLGQTRRFTPADSIIDASGSVNVFSIILTAEEGWNGVFQGMSSVARLEPGYFGSLRSPFGNPARGGLSWSGAFRSCGNLTGWFVVDEVTYSGAALTSIALRFEQHCNGATPALHGAIRWDATDTSLPAGPIDPPPAGLWSLPAGALPVSGNAAYLESEPGDFIGRGQTLTLASPAAVMDVFSSAQGLFAVSIGDWGGAFAAMTGHPRLEPGYYGDLRRYPYNNPAKGGLDWSGQGRGCNTLTGWFVVDAVTYSGANLTSLLLRFEQHCEGATPALRGAIRWAAP